MFGLAVAAGFLAFSGKESVGVTVEDARVFVETADLDVEFSRGDSVSQTFMLFGGTAVHHGNVVSKITLAGLNMSTARKIHRKYPDFYKCASPGAAMAKSRIKQLDIVPVDGSVLDVLEDALGEFNHNVRNGGDRICVRLKCAELKLERITARAVGEVMTKKFGQHMKRMLLVTGAEKLEAESLLAE